jgi:uncharacterized membrane protein SirB2
MNSHQVSWAARRSAFGLLALLTGLVLLVPLTAMQFSPEVAWSGSDFVIMGLLVYLVGSLFIIGARRLPRRHWRTLGIALGVLFVYVWAELAVGIFTTLGS